jgi:pyroglutamyl-peptidase
MNKPRRILIYGFGAYRQFRDNITARIIKSLPAQPGLKKVVFPVRFHRRQFIGAIERLKPNVILGLGQSSRRRIDLEAQALNQRRANRADPPRLISARGPGRLRTTLKLKAGRQAGKSANAGDYVCNFSMYVMLDHIRRNGLDVLYGFIHIPYDYKQETATQVVEKILRRCQRASLKMLH